MSQSRLCLHRGAREVPREILATVPTPAPAKRWVPIGHAAFVDAVMESLAVQGFAVERERYALGRDDARLFGVLDIGTDIDAEATLAVGIRSSLDQSFPLGFCAGNRVFVCDNLSFSAELMAKRKHTARGLETFRLDIGECVSRLPEFAEAEARRIERMRRHDLTDTEAESYMLRAYERRLVSHRQLPAVIREWREPTHEAFGPRTLWSLFNAFTLAVADRARSNPQQHARQTMSLQALLSPRGGDEPGLLRPSPEANP